MMVQQRSLRSDNFAIDVLPAGALYLPLQDESTCLQAGKKKPGCYRASLIIYPKLGVALRRAETGQAQQSSCDSQ